MHIYIAMSEYLSDICYKRQNSLEEAKYLTVSSMTHFSLSVLQFLWFSCTTIEGRVCLCARIHKCAHKPSMHIHMSLDVHLDLGFNKKLEALSEVFHHLRSHFFLIPALCEVGYWEGCLA